MRNGSSGTPSVRAVWRMFSSTKRSWPGSASAERRARSYWPRTRWPMKPRRSPNWRVVIQRFARASDAFPSPAPGRHDLVEELSLQPPEERPRRWRGWPGPSRGDRRRRRAPRSPGGASRGPPRGPARRAASPPRRRGRPPRPRPAERRPAALRRRPSARRSTAAQSTRPVRASASARRPSTVTAAPSAAPTRKPACQTAPDDGRPARSRAAHRATGSSEIDSTAGKASPNMRAAIRSKAATSPVVITR